MSNLNVTATQTDQSLSAIDAATSAALAAARARKAAKSGNTTEGTTMNPNNAAPAPKRVIKTPEQRIEEAKQREAERAQRKADRQAKREAEKAAKPAAAPAHMKKVEKAAERLPALSEDAKHFFEDAKVALSTNDLIALAAHLQLHCRASATVESSTRKLTEGQQVTITTTDVAAYAKFIGKTGTVAKANRVRCYIAVPGVEKLVYLHISDVTPAQEVIEQASSEPEQAAGSPEANAA